MDEKSKDKPMQTIWLKEEARINIARICLEALARAEREEQKAKQNKTNDDLES